MPGINGLPGVRTMVQQGANVNLTPETKTYISGLVTPISTAQKKKIDKLVKDLKTGLAITNLSDFFDVFYVLANETAELGLRNLVKRANDATAINSPSFVALEGFAGNGTSSYLNSNYNQNLHSVKSTLNSTSIGVYSRSNLAGNSNSVEFGARTAASSKVNMIHIFIAGAKIAQGVNNGGAGAYGNILPNSKGLVCISRNSASDTVLYKNGIYNGIDHSVSTSLSEYNIFLGALNQANSAVGFSTHQISIGFIGKNIATDSQALIISNSIESYMNSNGKGVIA